MTIVVEPYHKSTDVSDFCCGEPALDRYIKTQAGQDMKRRIASCFVASDGGDVLGFYTLSSASVVLSDLPEETVRKLPRYGEVPVVRLGRLAVDKKAQGKKIGAFLLIDAFERVLKSEIAAFAVIVEPKNDHAKAFYQHFGFDSFGSQQERLFYMLAKFQKNYVGA